MDAPLGIHFDEDLELVWIKKRKKKEKPKPRKNVSVKQKKGKAKPKPGYEKEVNMLKKQKEVSTMYSESILEGCDVR